MTQQTRRQFFKTVAATCAGIGAAAVVAPAVVRGGEKPLIKLWSHQQKILLDLGKFKGWKNHTATYDPSLKTDPLFLEKLRFTVKNTKFIPPIGY